MKQLYQIIFKILKILPTYYKKDLNNLGKLDKAIIGIRYWLTIKILK
jgi:hypothetical protein